MTASSGRCIRFLFKYTCSIHRSEFGKTVRTVTGRKALTVTERGVRTTVHERLGRKVFPLFAAFLTDKGTSAAV